MKTVDDILRTPSVSQFWSGGRGPAQFAREMERSSKPSRPFESASTWVRGFAHAVPGFGEYPVYGELLGKLADSVLHKVDVQPSGASPRRPSLQKPRASSRRDAVPGFRTQQRSVDFAEGESARSKFSRPMLSSNVGKTEARALNPVWNDSSSGSMATSAHVPAAKTPPRGVASAAPAAMTYRQHGSTGLAPIIRSASQANSISGRRPVTHSAAGSFVFSSSSAALEVWRQTLTERVRAKLHSYGIAETRSCPPASLPDIWTVVGNGQPATTDVLLGAMAASVFSAVEVISAPPTATPPVPCALIPAQQAIEEASPPAQRYATLSKVFPSTSATPLADFAGTEEAAIATMLATGEELLTHSAGSSSLPLLLPTHGTAAQAVPAPAPAALTTTAMAPISLMDSESDDELAELSLKMKRVLDEEARRHGIKV